MRQKIKFLQEDYDAVAKYYESKITLITEESSKGLKYFLTIYDKIYSVNNRGDSNDITN